MFVCVLNYVIFQICVSVCESVCDTAHLLWFKILQANRVNSMLWNNHIIQFFVVWTYDTYIISMHSTYMSCIMNFTFTFFWYHIANTFCSTKFIYTKQTWTFISKYSTPVNRMLLNSLYLLISYGTMWFCKYNQIGNQ